MKKFIIGIILGICLCTIGTNAGGDKALYYLNKSEVRVNSVARGSEYANKSSAYSLVTLTNLIREQNSILNDILREIATLK